VGRISLPIAVVLASIGCSSVTDGSGGAGGGGAGGSGGAEPEPVKTVLYPEVEPLPGFDQCEVTIWEHLPFEGHTHVPICTDVEYQTDPPSSGNHWPIWAEYRAHAEPVPRMMLVHNLEHGAVVMAHNCDEACASQAMAAFESVADTFGADALCATSPAGAIRSRIIMTPQPSLQLPIALSAWRSTYTATCIDEASLLAFVEQHYGNGPEATCAQGKDPLDPTVGVTACP
jgi:hypothetical protein